MQIQLKLLRVLKKMLLLHYTAVEEVELSQEMLIFEQLKHLKKQLMGLEVSAVLVGLQLLPLLAVAVDCLLIPALLVLKKIMQRMMTILKRKL